MANTQTEQVTIDGIAYDVFSAHTPEQVEAEGHPGTAAQMRKVGSTRHLYLRRPKGRGVMYFVVEFAHRNSGKTYFGNVLSLGKCA